jgi:hypothetical protein
MAQRLRTRLKLGTGPSRAHITHLVKKPVLTEKSICSQVGIHVQSLVYETLANLLIMVSDLQRGRGFKKRPGRRQNATHRWKPVRERWSIVQREAAMRTSPAAAKALTAMERA